MPALRPTALATQLGLLVALLLSGPSGCSHPSRWPPPPPSTQLRSPQGPPLVAGPPLPGPPPPAVAVAVRPPLRPPSYPLPGGARLIIEPDRLAGTVALALFVSAGAKSEPTAGLRHLLERTLLDSELPAGALAAQLRQRGGEVLAFTGPDYTVYQIVLPKTSWTAGLNLLNQLLSEPPQSADVAAALSRQRQAIAAELTSTEPDGASLRRLLAAIDPDHPYRRPLLGTLDSLAAVQESELRAFYRQHYRGPQLTLVLAGDVDPQDAQARLSAGLAVLPAAGAPPDSPAEQPAIGRRGLQVSVQPQPATSGPLEVLLGFAIPAAPSADLPALELAAALLEVEGEAAVGESIGESRHSFLISGREPGALVVRCRRKLVDGTHGLDDLVGASLTAALRLAQREVPRAVLERASRRLLTAASMRSETPGGRTQRLGAFALLGIDEAEYEARLRGLTPAALRESLQPYLRIDNLTISVAAPAPLLDAVRLRSLALAAAASGTPTVAVAPLADSAPAARYRLRSGAQLILLPDSRRKTVAIATVWAGGTRLEEERSAGLHELLTRAWPRVGRSRSGEPAAAEQRELAASLEAHLGPDSFGLRAQLLSSDLQPGLELLRDCLESPALTEAELERGRRDLLLALGGRHGGPQQLEAEAAQSAWRLFIRNLLGGHPYGLAPTVQSVNALSRRRLLEFYRQHYSRAGLVLALVGDFTVAGVLAELSPWLGPVVPLGPRESPLRPALPPLLLPRPTGLLTQTFALGTAQQAHLVLGFRAPGLRSGGPAGGDSPAPRAAVELLAELLLDGRIERALKSRRGLATAVSGQLSTGLETGYLAFYLATTPARLEAAEATLRDELHRLVDHPVKIEELELARDRLIARRALAGQRWRDRALELAQAVALGLPDRAVDGPAAGPDLLAQLRTVDVGAVQTAAQQLLRDDQMVRAVVLPQPSAGPLPSLDLRNRPTAAGQVGKALPRPKGRRRLLASRQPVPLPIRRSQPGGGGRAAVKRGAPAKTGSRHTR